MTFRLRLLIDSIGRMCELVNKKRALKTDSLMVCTLRDDGFDMGLKDCSEML